MKKFFKNKFVRLILAFFAVLFLVVGYEVLQEYIGYKRSQEISSYFRILVNKPNYFYTDKEMRYMAKVEKYLEPLTPFVSEKGEYERLKKNNKRSKADIDINSVDYQLQMNSWAAKLQKQRPRHLKKGDIWIPGSNLSVPLPKEWEEVFDPYTSPYLPLTAIEANSTVLKATDDSNAFMLIQADSFNGDLKATVTNIEEGLSFFDILKHDRTDATFSNEFETQVAAGFESTFDGSGLQEGWDTPTYDIKHTPTTINGQQFFVSRLTNQFSDGEVVHITYYSQAGIYLLTTKAMYRLKDEARIKPKIEKIISNVHTFTLDYLTEEEPDYHGLTKQEEKTKSK